MQAKKYQEFLRICCILNTSLNIKPVLFGSLGLEKLTSSNFQADDIDVLIPNMYLTDRWNDLREIVEHSGYIFVDLHEHEFKNDDIKLAFGDEESLWEFAQVDIRKLRIIEDEGAKYRLLNVQDYLRTYTQYSKDSYRASKNNSKDLEKIHFLNTYIKNR